MIYHFMIDNHFDVICKSYYVYLSFFDCLLKDQFQEGMNFSLLWRVSGSTAGRTYYVIYKAKLIICESIVIRECVWSKSYQVLCSGE